MLIGRENKNILTLGGLGSLGRERGKLKSRSRLFLCLKHTFLQIKRQSPRLEHYKEEILERKETK